MNALFLTMRKIFPMNDGAFIYSFGILKYLKEHDMEISFVSFYEKEPYSTDEEKKLLEVCKSVDCVKLNWRSTALNLSLKYPNNIRKYTRNAMVYLLNQKKEEHFDVVIIDHLQMFEYAKLFPNSKIVLIEHNVESKIWENYAEKCKGIIKYLVQRSATMTKKYEIEAISQADAVVSIAETDAEYLSSISGRRDIAVMHPYNKYQLVKTEADIKNRTKKILFVGSYGWYPNQQAAKFLATELMPILEKKVAGIQLYLVGKDPTPEIMKYAEEDKSIIVTGVVDSVDPYIKEADIFINAMFDGSGMNIKMMEAMGKGIPLITSDFGRRGIDLIDGKEALVFSNADDCAEKIEMLLNDVCVSISLAKNARKFYLQFIEPDNTVYHAFFKLENML